MSSCMTNILYKKLAQTFMYCTLVFCLKKFVNIIVALDCNITNIRYIYPCRSQSEPIESFTPLDSRYLS